MLADGPVVLFWYPAAMTTGCTKEACHFRDIAAELGISEHTVKVHLWRLFKRLGVKSRTQTLHFARQNGLLNL